MRLRFHTLDVFTTTRFGGNPLAVVMDADGLDRTAMQAIAREFNLSETVFVMKPENPAHSARVRIFTPARELPFAGHPTIGTATLLADLRAPDLGGSRNAIIALEEEIGIVRIGVRLRPGEAAFAEFDAPRLPTDQGAVPAMEDIAAAVGLIPSEIGFENHRPSCFSAGVPFHFIPVRSLEAIAKARCVVSRWEQAFGRTHAGYLYCRETAHNSSQFHARMFAPGLGVTEDPATGSAAAAFAAVIARHDQPPGGEHRYLIEQGFEMGRPSHIQLSLVMNDGRLQTVRIGGHAVRVANGEIEV
ncbi:MAG: PhzF family phenazine biosynthesis protein [Hyphomicrobiaceae bacterium]|nr:PhzF family phenazine biosynthesis protein [Hyphomicrobiaceae bacterium]